MTNKLFERKVSIISPLQHTTKRDVVVQSKGDNFL